MVRKLRISIALLTAVTALGATSTAHAGFTSAGYPASISGTSSSDVIDVFGTTVKCTFNSFSGSLGGYSSFLQIYPSYNNCTAFGLPATVDMNGCYFLFWKPTGLAGSVDIDCWNIAEKIEITVYTSSSHATAICRVDIPRTFSKKGFTFSNIESRVVLTGSIASLPAVVGHNTSIACPKGPETKEGTYTIQPAGIWLSGNKGAISVD